MGVRAYSVHAVVRGRDHHGEHLPPRAAEAGGAVHQRAVEIQRSLHRRRIRAHDGDNAPDPPGSPDGRIVQLLQQVALSGGITSIYGIVRPPSPRSNQKQHTRMDRMSRIKTSKNGSRPVPADNWCCKEQTSERRGEVTRDNQAEEKK